MLLNACLASLLNTLSVQREIMSLPLPLPATGNGAAAGGAGSVCEGTSTLLFGNSGRGGRAGRESLLSRAGSEGREGSDGNVGSVGSVGSEGSDGSAGSLQSSPPSKDMPVVRLIETLMQYYHHTVQSSALLHLFPYLSPPPVQKNKSSWRFSLLSHKHTHHTHTQRGGHSEKREREERQ